MLDFWREIGLRTRELSCRLYGFRVLGSNVEEFVFVGFVVG